MQELINAMLKVILQDSNQQKPIHYSVRRWTDFLIEFHSWFRFSFEDEWYITITKPDENIKVRVRDWVTAKISPDVLKVLKQWMNQDFNSWIEINDKSSTVQESNEPSVWEENWWQGEEDTETSGDETKTETETNEKADGAEAKKPNRPSPSWANVKR